MRIQLKTGRDLIFADKPAGFSTHAVDTGKEGFVEWLESRIQQKLWVVHRLDKTTTGAMVFATTKERAEELRAHFEKHEVRKKYWFLTDRASSEGRATAESLIEKRGSQFVSEESETPNSKTVFTRIKRSPFFELWQAEPLSGKPHQVRLHAAQIGLPILGDTLYGGTKFPHLCLHSMSLHVPGESPWVSPAPRFFERLGVLKDPELCQLLASLDRRQRLFDFLNHREDCLRLIHSEVPDFRLDKFGRVLWLNWYREKPPTERDLERWNFISTILSSPLLIQKRQDRGQDPNSQSLWELLEVPEKWTAQENGLTYEFRREQGLSAGLFLDQRRNREKLASLCAGKSVLNLFAYTGGFSLTAAKAGASKVTTVDLSKSFLAWGQQNFRLNDLNPEQFEWSAADTFLYLQGAIKRSRKWDIVVCDPPSFSRKGKDVFRLKDDIDELMRLCLECLAPNGTLLFSCNLESADMTAVEKRLHKIFPQASIKTGEYDADFELPLEERNMKSFWITFGTSESKVARPSRTPSKSARR